MISPRRTLAPDADEPRVWRALLDVARRRRELASPTEALLGGLPSHPLVDLYLPLLTELPATCAVAHLAQSLDGRIATARGGSRWLSGEVSLRHAHRMRALFDAVVVGTRTAELDDPQLTVRLVEGPNPVRVLIDASLSLSPTLRALGDGLAETLVVADARRARGRTRVGKAELVLLPATEDGQFAPRDILDALAARGLRRVYVEGGGLTVSRFLAAGCLERLQLTIAPMLIGSGRPSVVLPEIAELGDALRPRTRQVLLDDDILVECILRSA